MGLLDDAIREHLELKRRHGADPGEVAKLESEAFGPVRESAEFADRDAPQASAPAVEDAPAGLYDDEDAFGEPPAERARPAEPEAALPEARPLDEEPPPPPVDDEPLAEAPAPPAEPDPQATVAFSLHDEVDAEAPAPPAADEPPAEEEASAAPDVVPADSETGEHDELSETPDFLEDAPEHDRLWFEQKPPRDFDF
jgi:hypothetical protein